MIFDPKNSKISIELKRHGNNKRNSEGDFIRLKDGRIMFAFSYYLGEDWTDHSKCDIRCIYSDDDGKTFYPGTEDGEARLLVSAETFGQKNVMSVSLMRMENGDVGMFYILKDKDNEYSSEILLSKSCDECESFYETVKIAPLSGECYNVLNNNRIERTSSGRIIVPIAVYIKKCREDTGYGYATDFYYSDDDGKTWDKLETRITLKEGLYSVTGLQEPGIIELKNGDLYTYSRTDLAFQYESISKDGGKTWSEPKPSRFSSPTSPMKIAKNPYTGQYFAVWNPAPIYMTREITAEGWGRTPLVIAKSEDGFNFDLDAFQVIEDDPLSGFCYPAVFFADEKTMLLSYCSGGPEDESCLTKTTIRRIELE